MSYIPEYHENYYRVEGTAYNQGKIGIGTINPVQLLHVSGGNIRVDGTGYINGDLNVTGNLNVYGTTAQFAISQVIAEDKSLELNVATGTAIGGGNYTTAAFSDDAGANDGGIVIKSTSLDSTRGVQDKVIVYRNSTPASGWVSNLRWNVSGNYGKDTLNLTDTTADVGMTIGGDCTLFRSGTNVLSTDDRFGITFDGGKNTLHLNNTAVNVGITIGQDTNLYRSGVDTLRTDDNLGIVGNFNVDGNTILGDSNADTVTINAGPVSLVNATAAIDALEFGAGANLANLYRSANDTLRTDDSLIVNVDLTVNGNTTLGDANTDTVTFNARANTNLEPSTNNTRNLGSSALNWGTAFVNTLQVAANSTLTGNLTVNGNTTLGDATTDTSTINGTLTNSLPDNTATAVDFKENTNSYLKLTTSDSSELVTIGATPKFTSLNTTDATNSTTAAATFVGGVGIAKKLYVGTDFNVNGNTVLGDAYTDTVLITGKLLRGILTYSGAGVITQASSISIANDKVIVTGAGILNGALSLPAAIAGMEIEVKNRAGQAINIYANSSPGTDRIFDSSVLIANNTALALASNSNKNFVCAPSGGINIWFT
jgi:hypothetical protein